MPDAEEAPLPDRTAADDGILEALRVGEPALYEALRSKAVSGAPAASNGNRPAAIGEAATAQPQTARAGQPGPAGTAPPEPAPTTPPESVTAARPEPAVEAGGSDRPLRHRCETRLPHPLGSLARVRGALSALSASYDLREAETFGLEDPQRFARENRRSMLRRLREGWWSTSYERLLEASILLPMPAACPTVAVISPKGGVGKTTITGLLASLFSFVRHNITIGVDANPDKSNLGRKLVPGRGTFIDELLNGVLAQTEFTPMDVLSRLGDGPDGLYVAPSPNAEARALDEAGYRQLYRKLARVAEVLVLDCGTGLDSAAMHAALGCADQLVLVTDGDPEAMDTVADPECLELLRRFSGPVFVVVNKWDRRACRRVSLVEFERELCFCEGIVEVSYDEAAQRLRTFSWGRQAPRDWAISLRELAALIAMSWPVGEQGS